MEGYVLVDKITGGINDKLRNEQAGFRSVRQTKEQIFILHNIIEQLVNEWQATLYINFIDSEKDMEKEASDGTSHKKLDELWILPMRY